MDILKEIILHNEEDFEKNDQKPITTLCNGGVQILKRKVSELFENGQKKCPKTKSLDILWEFPGL
jgi:hypothetical protein